MRCLIIVTFLVSSALSAAELKLAHVLQDRMVLQRGTPVPVWGWADAGSKVEVKFAGQKKSATTNKDGAWKVVLDALEASSDPRVLTASSGETTLKRKDVLVGEVWFCAGQSNMARTLSTDTGQYPRLRKHIGNANLPLVRFIRYGSRPSMKPRKDRAGEQTWQALGKKNVGACMSMPYFFARELRKELQVPIGLIQVAVSGTPQTAWAAREILDSVGPSYEADLRRWQEKYPGKKIHARFPTVLHNGQVHPIAPYAFRGLIWHQGESGPFGGHAERMKAIVDHWRKLFEQDFVYLWGALGRGTSTAPPLRPKVRLFYRSICNQQFLKAQKLFGYESNSAYVDFYHLGNNDTHWGMKHEGGRRFALAAMSLAYGKPRVFTGPQLIKHEVGPGRILLRFTRVGGGLVYRPSIDGISGFVLQNGERYFWIEPTVKGTDALEFKDERIKKNSNLFYAYSLNPHETLFNKDGFPASAFQMKPGRAKSPDQKSTPLVRIVKPGDAKVSLNCTHVRRNVIVIMVTARKGKGTNRVRVAIPKEWKGVAARHKDKPVELGEPVEGNDGYITVELSVATNADAYLIYNKAKEAEALAEADLKRF